MNRGLQWLMAVDVAVYLLVKLAGTPLLCALALPAGWDEMLSSPWSPVSYMFTHAELWHMLANLVLLAVYAKALTGPESLWQPAVAYFVGGLAGAAVFEAFVPVRGACLIGASAAVLGVAGYATAAMPAAKLQLWPGFRIPLWAAALTAVVLVASEVAYTTPEASAAHFAGLGAGLLMGLVIHPRPTRTGNPELAALLDKARTSGYDSLTDDERRRLYYLSDNHEKHDKTH